MQKPTFTVTGLDLSGYMVEDTPRAIAFYRDALGLEPTTTYPGDAGAEYEFSDGTTFGLWNPGETMPFQPAAGLLFAVDDIDAAVDAVKARGIPVIMEHESPVCWMAMIEDTEGNKVVLHERKH
jgi:predicted enzyme related to lactoylglutathione lyase